MKQYLSIVEDIFNSGSKKHTRSGKTLSNFHYTRCYNVYQNFPIVTTKKMWFNGIVDELLWMLSGSTNVNDLKPSVQKIWEPWASEDGELGPVYGQQFRNWSGHYDQLQNVIEGLRENPHSRRHVLTLWNAPKIQYCALPPCHGNLIQFYVNDTYKDMYLNMSMYQRSADVALGLPWNITFYGLFLHMMANVCGYEVGTFHHTTGDTHIYYEHREGLEEQLERHLLEPPEVKVTDKDCIDDYEHDDFELVNYKHHPQIDFEIKV